MEWKFKVPCDAMFDSGPMCQALDGKSSGDEIDEEIGVYFGGDDGFPQNELCIDKTISFEFQMMEDVPVWCYAKDLNSAKSIVDYLSLLTGENPHDVYDRWIFEL